MYIVFPYDSGSELGFRILPFFIRNPPFEVIRKKAGASRTLREFLFDSPYDRFRQTFLERFAENPFFDLFIPIRHEPVFGRQGQGISDRLLNESNSIKRVEKNLIRFEAVAPIAFRYRGSDLFVIRFPSAGLVLSRENDRSGRNTDPVPPCPFRKPHNARTRRAWSGLPVADCRTSS